MYNFIVFPYRDHYYERKYGTVVRDHQIIKALSENRRVKSVSVINRPISIYEKVLWKHGTFPLNESDKILQCEILSLDLVGPIKKRLWAEYCYDAYYDEVKKYLDKDDGVINVILDFTPIAKIQYEKFENCIIWYDVIDNFSLHNRYSEIEKIKVLEKYKKVENTANLITGVSQKSLDEFEHANKIVVHNGLLTKAVDCDLLNDPCEFGFVGFVSDKFDIELLRNLTQATNRRAVIYGKIQDKGIEKQLNDIDSVTVMGEFRGYDLPSIMKTFKIGLIPYLKSKSHDESPLKLYEYLNYGKPVISSEEYEINNEYVHKYHDIDGLNDFVDNSLKEISFKHSEVVEKVKDKLTKNDFWEEKIEKILSVISGFNIELRKNKN